MPEKTMGLCQGRYEEFRPVLCCEDAKDEDDWRVRIKRCLANLG